MKRTGLALLLSSALIVFASAAELPKASTVFTVHEFFPERWARSYHSTDTDGVIVLKDKRALFWSTRAKNQELRERYRTSTIWVPPPPRSYRPEHTSSISLDRAQQKLPAPKDVFCIHILPDNDGPYFTPASLLAALPNFVQGRPPQEELEAPGVSQRGIIVLTDGRVLPWRTHSKRWILFDQFDSSTGFFQLSK